MIRRKLQQWLYYFCSYCTPYQPGPVRRLFSTSLLALVGFGLMAAVLSSGGGSSLLLEVDSQTVVEGEQFYIDILVDATEPINAVDVQLAYPQHSLEIESLRQGESVLTIWTEPPYVENGVIYISGGTFRRGFSGTHRILSVSARATQTGVIRITPQEVLFLAGDGTGDSVSVSGESNDSLRLYSVATQDAAAALRDGEGGRMADLDGDGRVTLQDISIFMTAWHNGSPIYDFTGDGRMTFRDFSILLAEFFRSR